MIKGIIAGLLVIAFVGSVACVFAADLPIPGKTGIGVSHKRGR